MLKITLMLLFGLFGSSSCAEFDEVIPVASNLITRAMEKCREHIDGDTFNMWQVILATPTENLKTKCLRACLMKSVNVMNSAGKFDKPVAVEVLKTLSNNTNFLADITQIFDVCAKMSTSDDHCVAADEYSNCMVVEVLKIGDEDADVS